MSEAKRMNLMIFDVSGVRHSDQGRLQGLHNLCWQLTTSAGNRRKTKPFGLPDSFRLCRQIWFVRGYRFPDIPIYATRLSEPRRHCSQHISLPKSEKTLPEKTVPILVARNKLTLGHNISRVRIWIGIGMNVAFELRKIGGIAIRAHNQI